MLWFHLNFCVPILKGSAPGHLPEQACRSFPVPSCGSTETADCGWLCSNDLDGGPKDMGLPWKHFQMLWWHLPTASGRCKQIPSDWCRISGPLLSPKHEVKGYIKNLFIRLKNKICSVQNYWCSDVRSRKFGHARHCMPAVCNVLQLLVYWLAHLLVCVYKFPLPPFLRSPWLSPSWHCISKQQIAVYLHWSM